jgi:hypothetical protein
LMASRVIAPTAICGSWIAWGLPIIIFRVARDLGWGVSWGGGVKVGIVQHTHRKLSLRILPPDHRAISVKVIP